MKKIILLTTLILFSLVSVAGALPTNVDDRNHFYQEITVTADSARSGALIHLWIPYPIDFSGALETYKFYDASGNLLQSHVFGGNDTHASASVRLDLAAGINTIWMTAGNTSEETTETTNVYDFYNYSEIYENVTLASGNYNFVQLKLRPEEARSSAVLNVTLGTQRLTYVYYNSTSNAMQYWYNASSSAAGFVTIGGNMNGSTNNSVFMVADGTEGKTIFNSQSSMPAFAPQNGGMSFYKNSGEYITAISGTNVVINYSNSVSSIKYPELYVATGNYTPIEAVFGDVVIISENIDGIYLRAVAGGDGNVLRISQNLTSVNLGGNLALNISNSSLLQASYPLNASISAMNTTDVYGLIKVNATETMMHETMTSVVFVPGIENESITIDLKPIDYGLNNSTNANVYDVRVGPNQSVITIPITQNVIAARTGLFGQIVDGSGNPISGVSVEYLNTSTSAHITSTESVPGGMFGYAPLPANTTVYLVFNKTGYVSNSTYGTIGPTNTTNFVDVIVMEKLYNISISVVDEAGNPINSFTTFLGRNQTIKSTDNGTVIYQNVTAGEQEVIIQAAGYSQVTKMIIVSENSTNFILSVTPEPAIEYTSPHYVRLFYRTITGTPVVGLNVTVYDSSGDTEIFQAVTGTDGSVSFRLNETIQYRFVAMSGSTVINEFVAFPKSSEYVIFVSGSVVQPPSDVLSGIMYSITEEGTSGSLLRMRAAADTTTINVSMRSNSSSVVDYNIIVYQESTIFETRSGNFTDLKTETFTVPRGYVYTISITYTDEDGKSRTVSKTLRLDGSSAADKVRFSIPGFTEEWHYSALCIFIVMVSSFSLNSRTKRIGGLLIPGEMAVMGYVGWINLTSFAICLMISAVIMSLIYFIEKAGSDESLS